MRPYQTGHSHTWNTPLLILALFVSICLVQQFPNHRSDRSSVNRDIAPAITEAGDVTPPVPTANPSPTPSPSHEIIRQKLHDQLLACRPTHRLSFRNGQIMEGRIISETDSHIRFREYHGYSGAVTATYKRSHIQRVEILPASLPEISQRDVELAGRLPGFHYTRITPYSFFTDEPYGHIEKILHIVTGLHDQFHQHFAPILQSPAGDPNIQVIFFGSEREYRRYADKQAPQFRDSAGFFSAADQRLVILNQLGAERYLAYNRLLDRHRSEITSPDHSDDDRRLQAARQLTALRATAVAQAKSDTERLIRHEAAHQLFDYYRVHSPLATEPTWLTEGLAQYCETDPIGHNHPGLVAFLAAARQSGALISLSELLTHRDEAGFFAYDTEQSQVAYAQSWALVQMLMTEKYQPRFFDYIRRSHDSLLPVSLLDVLDTDLAGLEMEWSIHLRRY
jgi:hypothetical protein